MREIQRRVHQEFSNLRPLGPSIIDANDVSKLSYNIASYHAHKDDDDGANDPEPATDSTTVSGSDVNVSNNGNNGTEIGSGNSIDAIGQGINQQQG